MNLEYNNPLLSYVIDFSNLPKEIKDAFNEQALIAMTAPPIKFHQDMDPTSDQYLVYLYENQQNENIKFEKETREQLDRMMAPFLTSLQAKKADTWIEMMIAKNLHEIVFAETSGSPFQTTCTTKKAIRCALSDIINDYEKIGEKLLNDYNKIASSGPYEVDCGVRGYQSHPSP
ncbi:13332_t:CDS:2 [Racocetra fulgida]|uniref:13332_t:CDS:1 n=1 Tax=Racocetra fulgida TaxID=60492 RepID=A0A9N9FMX7_9GLOM|nr:13332_t:CDS:2 [Racocetra fulgida]